MILDITKVICYNINECPYCSEESLMSKAISESTQRIINRIESEFTTEIVQLGNKLLNHAERGVLSFKRSDVTRALAGDEVIIETMRLLAVRKRWISKSDHTSIPRVVEWIRVIRNGT